MSGLFYGRKMTESCKLVLQRNVLESDRVFASVQAGLSIAQMLGEEPSQTCEVTIGGQPVPRALWSHVKPRAGQIVHVTVYPQGGNGGKLVRAVALIALVVVANVYGAQLGAALGLTGATAASVGSALIVFGGSLLINSLVPPPSATGATASSDPFNQLQSLTGTSNNANPYGVVPCVVGTTQFFPPHAALPYTEISGDDQYMRMLFDLGYGDLDISDIAIGGTPIDTYDDVEYEIGTSPSIFSQDVFEQTVGTALNNNGDTDTRTGQNPAAEMSVDLLFPSGLYAVTDKGKTVNAYVNVDIAFRQVGTTTWFGIYDQPGISISTPTAVIDHANNQVSIACNQRKVLRVGVRWKSPSAAQYEVKVTKLGTGWDGSVAQFHDMTWAVLRSINPSTAASTTGTTKLAVRIKATDQLNGVVQNLSVLASQKIPAYNPATSTWSANAPTENPGLIYPWLLTRCPAVIRRLDDSRLDLDGLAEWAGECAAKGYAIGFVMDSGRALGDICRDVLAAGRASFGLRNGKYSAVRDLAQSVPVQMFTPANSWGFNFTRAFADLPHALRVTFTNPEASWQKDVVIAYWDGYGPGNATRFEDLDLTLVIDPAAAWRLGRYHLAVMYLRPTTYQFTADIEHMVCERGDLITVAHDIIGWGKAWGRVKSLSGGRIVLDQPLQLDPSKSYQIRVRRQDNSQATTSGEPMYTWDSTRITFDNATDLDDLSAPTNVFIVGDLGPVQSGDLYAIGEISKVVGKLVVKTVEPGADLSATITAVDYATHVIDADSGTPPAFVSAINGKLWCAAPAAPKLNIRLSTSATNDAGLTHNEVGVSSNAGGGGGGVYRMPIFPGGSRIAIQ